MKHFFIFLFTGFILTVLASQTINLFLHQQLIESPKFLKFLTYDRSDEAKKYGPRFLTLWNIAHVLYFAIGGFLFPDKRLLLWSMGLLWEYIEDVYFDIGNPLDIFYNTIGILLSILIK